jgi:hypothetical protein
MVRRRPRRRALSGRAHTRRGWRLPAWLSRLLTHAAAAAGPPPPAPGPPNADCAGRRTLPPLFRAAPACCLRCCWPACARSWQWRGPRCLAAASRASPHMPVRLGPANSARTHSVAAALHLCADRLIRRRAALLRRPASNAHGWTATDGFPFDITAVRVCVVAVPICRPPAHAHYLGRHCAPCSAQLHARRVAHMSSRARLRPRHGPRSPRATARRCRLACLRP